MLKYVYDIPYLEQKELCHLIDCNRNAFEELAIHHMQFKPTSVQKFQQAANSGRSPTNELLKQWGYQNHTIVELFVILSKMKQYQAMMILKPFVDQKHHHMIKEVNDNVVVRELLQNMKLECTSAKVLNGPPQVTDYVSNEDNESVPREGQWQQFLKPKSPLPLTKTNTASSISQVTESASLIPLISYEELMKATNNWDTKTILGRGGFGIVFKGTWKCTKVAVKRIEQKANDPKSNEQMKQSITELHCLNAYRHDNILPLYGYSIGGPQPCLVYQYMSGGSLDYRLRGHDSNEQPLQWNTRLNIAIGTARGLQFLHTTGEKPLVHGDIKTANILLDHNDTPRIGDFGLAREGPSNYSYMQVSSIQGTKPYLPHEFLMSNKLSVKVDTYSFGIVLFELATALGAFSHKNKRNLKDHVSDYAGDVVDLKDAKVPGGENYFMGLMRIGGECVSYRPRDRPDMVSVLKNLESVV